jgi:hypothetical protein
VSTVRKALVAAGAAALAAVVQAAQKGSLEVADIDVVLAAAVLAGFATWRVPNEPTD